MKRIALFAIAALACASASLAQTSYSGTFYVSQDSTYSKTSGAMTATARFPSQLLAWGFTSGTNANQMNALFNDTVVLTNSEVRTYALAAVTNTFGDALNLWRVNYLILKAATGNVDNITIGGAEDHLALFGDTNQTAAIRPGGLFLMTAPSAAGIVATGKTVRITNAGTNANTFEIYIGGAK